MTVEQLVRHPAVRAKAQEMVAQCTGFHKTVLDKVLTEKAKSGEKAGEVYISITDVQQWFSDTFNLNLNPMIDSMELAVRTAEAYYDDVRIEATSLPASQDSSDDEPSDDDIRNASL